MRLWRIGWQHMWNQPLSTRSRQDPAADPVTSGSSESSESSHRGLPGVPHGSCKKTAPVPFTPHLQALCRGILRHHGGQDPRHLLPATNQSKKLGPVQKVDPVPFALLQQALRHGIPLPHGAQDPRHLLPTNRCRHRHLWHRHRHWQRRRRGRDPKHLHLIRWRSKFAALLPWTLRPAFPPPRSGCRGSRRCR